MCEALLAVRQRTRGPLGIGSRRDRPRSAFFRQGATAARPRRVALLVGFIGTHICYFYLGFQQVEDVVSKG